MSILIVLALTLLCIVGVFLFYVWSISKGELPELECSNDCDVINERCGLMINGVEQWMFLRGKDKRKPVLLYLHGGPGLPEFVFIEKYRGERSLEDDFVVCYWEQRGSGMSYSKICVGSLCLSQLASDTKVLTEYLCRRFQCETVYLMGHSWGAYLGLYCVDHFPELYRGYVGVGQPTNQCESEVLCWQELMRQSVVKRRFLDKILLKRYAPGKDVFMSNAYVYGVRNPMLGRDGIGIMHVKRHAMLSMAMMVIQSRCYTFMDKWYYLCGMQKSSVLYAEVVSRCYMPHGVLKIPVYFIHGKYDYLVSEKLARHYYEIVEAPAKDYVLFEHSAHSPLFEEADHFVDTVSSFLLGGNSGGRVV